MATIHCNTKEQDQRLEGMAVKGIHFFIYLFLFILFVRISFEP